jgi:hypothetical protein
MERIEWMDRLDALALGPLLCKEALNATGRRWVEQEGNGVEKIVQLLGQLVQ